VVDIGRGEGQCCFSLLKNSTVPTLRLLGIWQPVLVQLLLRGGHLLGFSHLTPNPHQNPVFRSLGHPTPGKKNHDDGEGGKLTEKKGRKDDGGAGKEHEVIVFGGASFYLTGMYRTGMPCMGSRHGIAPRAAHSGYPGRGSRDQVSKPVP